MARFLQGELGSPDAAIRLSHQVQWGEDEAGAFAYDWYMDRTIDNQLHLRSSGGTFAFSSYIEMYPAQGYGVVLLANRMNYTGNTQGELQQLSAEARAAIWGKAPVQTALENELQKNDYRNVAATVAKIRAAHPELRLSENYVNEWGYHFTAAKQFDAAIGLFQYNVATFPGSWNAWDSLAEGYEMSGDKRNAIDNYRHSLELNPANTHAVEALKRLNAMQ